MARKVPGPPQGKKRKFIPEAFENRADENPIAVWIKTPTEREKRDAMQEAAPQFEATENGAAPGLAFDFAASMRWQNTIVESFCVGVENYSAADGSEIATAADLVEHGETEIVSEIAAEILTALSLTEPEKKKSIGSSGTTPKTTQAPGGTVENAGRGDSQTSAGVV